jgi:hypothetical protein
MRVHPQLESDPQVPRHRAERTRWVRLVIPVALAVLVVCGAVLFVAGRHHGSAGVTPYRGSLPRFETPAAYRITYRVEPRTSSAFTEELSVRRPFDTYDANILHGEPYLTLVMRLGQQVFKSANGPGPLVYTPFAPSRRDIRLDAVAPDAMRAGLLRLVGRAKVLGASCYVFRSGAALNAGPLVPITRTKYVDSCIDRRGLLLGERTIAGGKLSVERRALRVATGAAASGADFGLAGQASPPDKGGGSMQRLTMDSRPSSGPFWDVPRPPAGFRHTGRFVLVPSQPQAYDPSNGGGVNAYGFPNSLVVSIDDVYVRGSDAVVIEQGSTINDAKFSPPDGGTAVDLGPVLGRGQLMLSATASEVTAEPHEGRRFVRIAGTLPPNELVAIARSMTLQPSGELRKAP